MYSKRTEAEKLAALHDALSESVELASDAELFEEARLVGIDPNVEAARLKALMLSTVKSYQQRALREARSAYDAQTQPAVKPSPIPSNPIERRNLFSFVLAKQPQYADLFTAQHREFSDLTDSDIESYLEDLAELGVLEKLKPGGDDDNK